MGCARRRIYVIKLLTYSACSIVSTFGIHSSHTHTPTTLICIYSMSVCQLSVLSTGWRWFSFCCFFVGWLVGSVVERPAIPLRVRVVFCVVKTNNPHTIISIIIISEKAHEKTPPDVACLSAAAQRQAKYMQLGFGGRADGVRFGIYSEDALHFNRCQLRNPVWFDKQIIIRCAVSVKSADQSLLSLPVATPARFFPWVVSSVREYCVDLTASLGLCVPIYGKKTRTLLDEWLTAQKCMYIRIIVKTLCWSYYKYSFTGIYQECAHLWCINAYIWHFRKKICMLYPCLVWRQVRLTERKYVIKSS